nr:GNAT family N-acetyltransferase [bacterium]
NDKDNAWLGFFGIKEDYRDKGYGKKSLKLTEEYAKSAGFKYMRLFTDKLDNEKAISFYEANGYSFEDYDCDKEELKDEFNVVIGSKSLCDEEVPLWDNKFINLTKQTYKQQYTEEIIEMDDVTTTETIDENIYYEEEKIAHKDRKRIKLMNMMLGNTDIKYRGILSYRYIRIIAWISLALAQYCLVLAMGLGFFSKSLAYPGWIYNMFVAIGHLSIPFFLLASFSIILSRNRTYKSLVLFYGLAYLGVALGLIFIYDRYIGKVIYEISQSSESAKNVVLSLFNRKTDFNVFGDLFILTLFNFFLNYELKKGTSVKKVVGFRCLSMVPLTFALASYVLTVCAKFEMIELPFEVYPFLTTKSPLIYLVFICMSLWIKNRERIYVKLGATQKEYSAFLRTNKNSLAFSIHVCLLFAVVVVIDLVFVGLVPDYEKFNFGQCISLILAIPFIMLFSYNKSHKDKNIDLLITFVGVMLLVFAYVEAIFEIIIAVLHQ